MGHKISNLYNYYQLNTVKSENLQTLFAISACFVTRVNDKVTNLTGYTYADIWAGVKVGLFKIKLLVVKLLLWNWVYR